MSKDPSVGDEIADQEELTDGSEPKLAKLPQFIVIAGDAAKGRLGAFDVVTSLLTIESIQSPDGARNGIVLVFTPEDARALAQALLHTASGLTPMADQAKAYQDAQDLLSSTPTPTKEED